MRSRRGMRCGAANSKQNGRYLASLKDYRLCLTAMDAKRQKGWVNTSTCKKGSWIPDLASREFSCCRCSHCAAVLTDTLHWTSMCKPAIKSRICIGNRVLVRGTLSGVVKYIGDLNSHYTHDTVYIGIKLDDPVGENNGMFNGKRFFSCPDRHGIIVPEKEVTLLPKCEGKPSANISRSAPPAHSSMRSTRTTDRSGVLSLARKSWAQRRIRSHSEARSDHTSSPAPQTTTVEPVVEGGSGQSDGYTESKSGVKEVEIMYSNEGDMFVQDAEGEERGEMTATYKTQSCPFIGRKETDSVHQDPVGTPVKPEFIDVEATPTTVARQHTGPAVEEEERPHMGTEGRRRFLSSQFSGLSGAVLSSSSGVSGERDVHLYSSSSCDSPTCDVRGYRDEGLASSPVIPPVPPTIGSNTAATSQDQMAINKQPSLTSCLMSRLPPVTEPPATEKGAEEVVDDMTSFEGVAGGWGGDMRAWIKASAYQKLKNAMRRGVQEIQWHRKIRELESTRHYPTLTRQFREMRANIGLNRRARAVVETRTAVLRKKMKHKTASVTSTKAELENVKERVITMQAKIISYPSKNVKIREMRIMGQGVAQGDDIINFTAHY